MCLSAFISTVKDSIINYEIIPTIGCGSHDAEYNIISYTSWRTVKTIECKVSLIAWVLFMFLYTSRVCRQSEWRFYISYVFKTILRDRCTTISNTINCVNNTCLPTRMLLCAYVYDARVYLFVYFSTKYFRLSFPA